MSALVLLSLLAGAVETPLGPWARPGVPALLDAQPAQTVDLDGWTYRVEGPTAVHLPRLPLPVRDPQGRVLARLEPVAPETWLAGVLGDAPADLAARWSRAAGRRVTVVAIRRGLRPDPSLWSAFDLFDAVLVIGPVRPDEDRLLDALSRWHRAGGLLALAGDVSLPDEGAPSLGRLVRAEHLDKIPARVGAPGPPRVPRLPAEWPGFYELVGPPAARSGALRSARWIVLGAALASAVQLLLAGLGCMGRRTLVGGLVLVGLLGALVGGLRTTAEYEPTLRARILIRYLGPDGACRTRRFEVCSRGGPGAAVRPGPAWRPVVYRAGGDPWWADPGGACALGEGVVRIFLVEQVGSARPRWEPADPVRDRGDRPALGLLARAAPAGGDWRAGASPGRARPAESVDAEGATLELEVVAQN